MPRYQTKCESVLIFDMLLKIVSLKDKNQFYDPDKAAEKLGISNSLWPISGLIWPSGMVLAKIIHGLSLTNTRVLEVGCGIGLASLVAAAKKADITASDFHPLTEEFLLTNADLNRLRGLKYITANWNHPITGAGRFDLIIGSDLLYEAAHGDILARFIDLHLKANGRVLLVDPGRRAARKIKPIMEKLGYQLQITKVNSDGVEEPKGYFTKYMFSRSG